MNPDWLRRLFDDLDYAVGVVRPDNSMLYANRMAQEEFQTKGGDARCESFIRLVGEVREHGREYRHALVEELGFRWGGRIWPLGDDHVGFLGRRIHRSPVTCLTAKYHLEPAEARLALKISQGRTNLEIARTLATTSAAIKQRALSLYRRLKVRNRAQLAALVVRCLSENVGGD